MLFAQISAAVIFIAMFVMIVLEKFERHVTTLASGGLVLIIVFGIGMHSPQAIWDTLNLREIATSGFWYTGSEHAAETGGVNWATIIFIAGMMVMVEGLGKAGFFRWLCLTLAKAVNYRVIPLLICFMVMSAVLSMFIDSITVVLFLATVTMELAQLLKVNPVPFILAEVFCANMGGTATMCGNPPNIIIGTSLGYTFAGFISNTGIMVLLGFLVTAPFFWLCFRGGLKRDEANRTEEIVCPDPRTAISNKKAFVGSILVFLLCVGLLVTHAQTGLTVATIGTIAAILTLLVIMATVSSDSVKSVIKGVDYKTLMFFVGLFVSVGGLEQTGVLDLLAEFIAFISGGSLMMMIVIILWLSAIASAFIDNIPFAATMVPVVRSLAQTQGIGLDPLVWTLTMGANLGGNATPIGASANVVGISTSAKWGHPISWGTYCKYCVPATALSIIVSMLCLFVRYL